METTTPAGPTIEVARFVIAEAGERSVLTVTDEPVGGTSTDERHFVVRYKGVAAQAYADKGHALTHALAAAGIELTVLDVLPGAQAGFGPSAVLPSRR